MPGCMCRPAKARARLPLKSGTGAAERAVSRLGGLGDLLPGPWRRYAIAGIVRASHLPVPLSSGPLRQFLSLIRLAGRRPEAGLVWNCAVETARVA